MQKGVGKDAMKRLKAIDEAYFKGEISFEDYVKMRKSVIEESTGFSTSLLQTEGASKEVLQPAPSQQEPAKVDEPKDVNKPEEEILGVNAVVEKLFRPARKPKELPPIGEDVKFRKLWIVTLSLYLIGELITNVLAARSFAIPLADLVAGNLIFKAITIMSAFIASYFIPNLRYVVPKVLLGLAGYLIAYNLLALTGL